MEVSIINVSEIEIIKPVKLPVKCSNTTSTGGQYKDFIILDNVEAKVLQLKLRDVFTNSIVLLVEI